MTHVRSETSFLTHSLTIRECPFDETKSIQAVNPIRSLTITKTFINVMKDKNVVSSQPDLWELCNM